MVRYPPKFTLLLFLQEVKLEVEQAVDAGSKFCHLFYDTYDKNRHVSKCRLSKKGCFCRLVTHLDAAS